MLPFEYLRPLIVLTMLGYASYKDIKTREVNDVVWLVFGTSGLLLDLYEIVTGSMSLLDLAFPMGFMIVFALATGLLGFFGGADLLAFLALGLLQPRPVSVFSSYIGFPPILFPLTLVSNAIFVSASASILVLALNLLSRKGGVSLFQGYGQEPAWKKIVMLISARRMVIEKVSGPPFQYPLEYMDPETGELKLRLRPALDDDDKAAKTIAELRGSGHSWVWVSYAIPFLLALTFGYLVSITFGDILVTLISMLFSG